MAVVEVQSTAISNAADTPITPNPSTIEHGRLYESTGFAVITSGNSSGSIYPICKIRSSDRLSQVLLYSPDIGSTTTADIGLYGYLVDGAVGTVVDADEIASAVSLKDGAINASDVTFEAGAGVGSIANGEKRIWEALGLSADPHLTYLICLTLVGAADGSGTVCVRVRYVAD